MCHRIVDFGLLHLQVVEAGWIFACCSKIIMDYLPCFVGIAGVRFAVLGTLERLNS